MTTISDIIPEQSFSIKSFYQYAKQRDNNSRKIIYAAIAAGLIMSIVGTSALIYASNSYAALQYNVWDCIITTLVAFMFTSMLTTAAAGIIAITAEFYNRSGTEFIQEYNTAWNQFVYPEMIKSITQFQHITNNIKPSDTETSEYIHLYKLSENVRREANRGPNIHDLANVDYAPQFIALNNMMENYRNQHPV